MAAITNSATLEQLQRLAESCVKGGEGYVLTEQDWDTTLHFPSGLELGQSPVEGFLTALLREKLLGTTKMERVENRVLVQFGQWAAVNPKINEIVNKILK
ncbi:MAG: hypothetical protein ACOYK9_04290 [Chlamydiia bacterium]